MISIFKDHELQKRFEKDGYVTVSFLDEETLKPLRKFCTNELDYSGKGFYHVFLDNDLALRNKVIRKIKERFEEPMQGIFQESTFIYGSFTIKEPGPSGVKGSHQDWSLSDESKYPSMTLWCPLVDVDYENGCLGVLKGSHKLTANIRGVNISSEYEDIAPFIEENHLTYVPMKAGEAIIFDSRLIHFSPENRSPNARLVAACVFVPQANPSLRMYYRDSDKNPSKLEIFEVNAEYLSTRDYFDISRPENLKIIGEIDYDFKMLTKDDLRRFVAERNESPSKINGNGNIEFALSVSDLSKKYTIDGSQNQGKWALEKVSFGLERGDVLGLFGPNGSGKSTLLKVLSEVTKPTSGQIEYYGKLMAILELGTGFHPDLTGSENIYFNGRLLGISKREIQSRFDEIVAFSGIGNYVNNPVKYYSSGMYARLAFSVFAHMEPDILLLDEIFSTGDEEFREKSSQKILEMAQRGTTIILVSHNMDELFTVCNRYALMEDGILSDLGRSTAPVYEYLKNVLLSRNHTEGDNTSEPQNMLNMRAKEWDKTHEINASNEQIQISRLSVSASTMAIEEEILVDNEITVELEYNVLDNNHSYQIAFAFLDIFNHELFGDSTSFHDGIEVGENAGHHKLTWKIPANLLSAGTYKLNLRIKCGHKIILKINEVVQFEIIENNPTDHEPNYRYPIKIPSTLVIEQVK
ncbi:MAG: hypothetical protein COB85_04570 [Bacteroidetes bacterium]|nr:MAG: hypothetical protein COB85_04570 [Bacteroidota bacterium]